MKKEIEKILLKEGVLTKEEEKKVFTYYFHLKRCKMEDKAIEVRNLIIEKNIDLVYFVRDRYTLLHHQYDEDLANEGVMGLMTAIDNYDPSLNVKFSTYAVPWIKQRMYRYMDNNLNGIRIPVYTVAKIRKMNRLIQEAEYEGKTLTDEELMKELELDNKYQLKHLVDTKNTIYQLASLDSPVGEPEHGEVISLGDYLLAKDDVEKEVFEKIRKEKIEEIVDKCLKDEREKAIIKCRMGFEGERRTLREIGEEYNVSRERIRQIESKAIKKLRNPKYKAQLRDFYNELT